MSNESTSNETKSKKAFSGLSIKEHWALRRKAIYVYGLSLLLIIVVFSIDNVISDNERSIIESLIYAFSAVFGVWLTGESVDTKTYMSRKSKDYVEDDSFGEK